MPRLSIHRLAAHLGENLLRDANGESARGENVWWNGEIPVGEIKTLGGAILLVDLDKDCEGNLRTVISALGNGLELRTGNLPEGAMIILERDGRKDSPMDYSKVIPSNWMYGED